MVAVLDVFVPVPLPSFAQMNTKIKNPSHLSPQKSLNWIQMPLLPPDAAKAGIFPGGEGAQWPRGTIAVSPADPDFLLLPIDVGGLYRSLDGGKNWHISMVGWNARGANSFGIDPKNANRVIGVGANSMNWKKEWGQSPNGLYLSTDKAASWRHVLATPEGIGGKIAYDAGSYNARLDYCTLVYCLTCERGLLRSTDGGENWSRLQATPELGYDPGGGWSEGLQSAPRLAVDPRSGPVYLGGSNGLFRSDDKALAWARIRNEPVYSLAISSEGSVFISGLNQLLFSKDKGRTFSPLACKGMDAVEGNRIQDLTISLADSHRMLCWLSGKNFVWTRFVSSDGVEHWEKVFVDNRYSPLPQNGREGYAAWSPRDPKFAWCIGGDWVTKSVDGGKTFTWSNNGYNGIMTGGHFNFSTRQPNTVFVGFQDYNGAFTTDGGATWNYRDVSGKGWGGHEYGAFAASGGKVMWVGDAESWGASRRMRISRDGGAKWKFVLDLDGKPLEFKGPDASFEDPANPVYLFASDLRSTDVGATWVRMKNCDCVFSAAPASKLLYGKKGKEIVCSSDHGATWQKVTDIKGDFVDLAVDEPHRRLYVASEDRLKVWDGGALSAIETPRDQFDHARVWTVATDPKDPHILYVGGPMNLYTGKATVCRSSDGGKTWRNLTVSTPISATQSGEPHEVSCIRVHPVTREAWVAGECFGLWRIKAPSTHKKGVSATEASASRAVVAPVLK